MKNENIPYEEINNYYARIISIIFNEIEDEYPSLSISDKGEIKHNYSEEYYNALGYLDKAGYRGAEVNLMKRYYNMSDFKYYGLENLHDIRQRIEHYLESTNMKHTHEVYEYTKYDNIVNERMELIHDPLYHESYMKYYNLKYMEQEYNHISYFAGRIYDDVVNLEDELKEINNKEHNYDIKLELKKILDSYNIIKNYIEDKYKMGVN